MNIDREYYQDAKARVAIAQELRRDLMLICPDSQQDDEGGRANVGARAALRTAVELIEMNPPKAWTSEYLQGHWAGLIEAAMRIISDVELEMYDPRSHPERYEGRRQVS